MSRSRKYRGHCPFFHGIVQYTRLRQAAYFNPASRDERVPACKGRELFDPVGAFVQQTPPLMTLTFQLRHLARTILATVSATAGRTWRKNQTSILLLPAVCFLSG